jgi:hypothetical protein
MKKIILILVVILIAGVNVFSQNLTLSNSTNIYANGSTIHVNGDTNQTLYSYIFITNGSASNMSVKLKKKHISVIPGTDNYMCWGGTCLPDTSIYLFPYPTVINAGATNTSDFSGDYYPYSHGGTSKIRYTFYNMNQVNDSVCFFVDYIVPDVGINELNPVTASEIYPNPADNATFLSYSISSKFGTAEFRLIDLLGNKVQVIPIFNMDGKIKINTENLHSGIYFYSMMLDGRSIFTKKLIVRHN